MAGWSVATRGARAYVAAGAWACGPLGVYNGFYGRRGADFAAILAFRPGFALWQHVFTMPEGSIAFGSAVV